MHSRMDHQKNSFRMTQRMIAYLDNLIEQVNELQRVRTVSVKTMKIVKAMPE